MAKTVDRLGGLHVLVNNAGVNNRGPIEELSEEDFDGVIAANLKGPWLCCRAAAPILKTQKWGRVINLSSIMGEVSMPHRTPYASSKGGLTLMTKTLALEWAPFGINVNALCPGPFATEMNKVLIEDPKVRRRLHQQGPPRPLGRPRRARPGGRVPGLRGVELHHRAPACSSTGGITAAMSTLPSPEGLSRVGREVRHQAVGRARPGADRGRRAGRGGRHVHHEPRGRGARAAGTAS